MKLIDNECYLVVNARISFYVSFEMLVFQTKAQVVPNQGVWDMRGKQLYQGIQIRMWAIACFAAQRTVGEEALRYWQIVSDITYCCFIQSRGVNSRNKIIKVILFLA